LQAVMTEVQDSLEQSLHVHAAHAQTRRPWAGPGTRAHP
jgi:hypothetical protein